ncbi:MAG: cytochrome c biogenesis protein ResB [Candidatus Accumulibacter sp.]|jgi:hypothetical protein|nr:cytochrome c biogenesis protein ResB [Accumulibacter sp.]
MTTTRKLWQLPWGYPESALLVEGIALVGFLLQFTAGQFNFALLRAPANYIALVLLAGIVALGVRFRDSLAARWIAGVPMAVTLTGTLLLLGLCMEFTPQLARLPPPADDFGSRLGLRMMTSSWPFVLLYGLLLVSLGIATAKRLLRFSRRDFAFLCNHLGLWILLAASGLGAADMVRAVMEVREGETEWRAQESASGEMLELPIAIMLRDFVLEEYPPKLTVIDRKTSQPQPEGRPDFYQIDPARPEGRLDGWAVTLDRYLHEAVRIDREFRASPMPEATPAAFVTARRLADGETRSGWVSSGGKIPFFAASLTLDENRALVMTEPEPKRFASDIAVIPRGGAPFDAILEVNKPATAGDWMIYQYGYDTSAGKSSFYSRIELVYDPWLLPARIGMAIMAAGALLMIWNGAGGRRKKR